MKKIVKDALCLLLTLCLVCVCATVFYAETIFVSGDYSYTLLDANYVSIYSWDGNDTLIIPAMLDNYRVREIRNGCFNGRTDFSVVNFSRADNLYRIGYNSFKNTSISGTLNIPPQVNVVGASAFQNCDRINVLYYNAMSEVVSSQCFYDCDTLSEVYLTDGVKRIEMHAFSDCDVLSLVRIPETVTEINDYAFINCPNLVIYCYTNSYAQQYAEDKGIDYVLIDAPEPTEPPTDPPTDAPTEAPTDPATDPATEKPSTVPTEVTFILGDADGDGEISILDATKIQRVLASIDPDDDGMITLRGNVNDASELNILHATKIQRFIAGYEVAEPIGTEVTRVIG